MKATYNKDAKKKFTTSHRKENKCYFESYAALAPCKDYEGKADLKEVVELRIYGTGTSNTACIWIIGDDKDIPHTSGSGHAGGGGYNRAHAATDEAIRNAGWELEQDIHGESVLKAALKAIAEAVGYPDCAVYHAHP